MRFSEPSYLWLIIPWLALLAATWRHVHGMATPRKRLGFAVRLLIGILVVLALAGPEVRQPNQGLTTMFVLDRSDSISEADRAKAEQFVDMATRQVQDGNLVGLVVFGRDAVIDSAPAGRRELGPIRSIVDGSASDLAGAVRLASAAFPEGKAKRIVLMSDGNETSSDLDEVAGVAASDGIVIDHVTLGQDKSDGEAAIVALEAPEEAQLLQPIELRIVMDSTVQQTATVDVDRDGILIKKLSARLNVGKSSIVFNDKLETSGFHRYRATLHPEVDADSRNNIGMAFVAVRGRQQVLMLQDDITTSPLRDALVAEGLDVDLELPVAAAKTPEEFQSYDAILFNDVRANLFSAEQLKTIQAAVRDSGVGFAMIGGENSFLPGGYYHTPIAELLPVDLNLKQRKSLPNTALCIICDTSGSMGTIEDGVQKVHLAAKAAEETVKLLSPTDRVAVAGSTDGIEFVAKMQLARDKEAIGRQIERMAVGGGGIYCRPSMLKGEEVLMAEQAPVRHFLLLSDGDDAEDQDGCFAIAERMRSNKITTSVIAIGDGKDVGFLKRLAAVGGGRFYLAKHANQLPAVMTQDTSLMARSAIEEGAFTPKQAVGEPILRGLSGLPSLLAYCLTDSRPLAHIGMRTQRDDPLLATWQYGLGTSIAFTSDAQPRWAQNWLGWPGFRAFWSQAVREISRQTTHNDYQVAVHNEGGKGLIELKAYDSLGNPLTSSRASVHVTLPSGESENVDVTQQAPGIYSGSFESSQLGSYIVNVAEPSPAGGVRVRSSGFSVPYPPEYRTYRPNTALLARTSEITGGREIRFPEEALRDVKEPGGSSSELWSTLLFYAALLLPFDVAIRRLALPLSEITGMIWPNDRNRPSSASGTLVNRLNKGKEHSEQK